MLDHPSMRGDVHSPNDLDMWIDRALGDRKTDTSKSILYTFIIFVCHDSILCRVRSTCLFTMKGAEYIQWIVIILGLIILHFPELERLFRI